MSNRELPESNPMKRDLGSHSDEELATILVATRDEAACAELFDRYRKRVYLWCFRYTHDREEAVDCTQEIFVRIFNNIESFRGGSRLSTWIYRIARNHCLSLLAQRSRQWRQRLQPLGDDDVPDTGWDAQLRELEITHGLRRILRAAQRRMEPQELEAYVLHYREGMTVKEITTVLGCENLTGARTLIQNARRKFQRLVARKEFGDG
jgi:RNA polymerase sigma-70 factor (ECF subfamily)